MTPVLNIPEVVNQVFAFNAANTDRGLKIRLTGAADSRATADLEIFVRNAHEEARRLAVLEVVVDMTGLSFMSSSCFKAFIGWLTSVQELAPDVQYKVRFAWDPKSYWQRRSLQALKTFAAEVVQI